MNKNGYVDSRHNVIIASERMEEYHEYAQKLLANGYGYVCQCSSERTFVSLEKQRKIVLVEIKKILRQNRFGK